MEQKIIIIKIGSQVVLTDRNRIDEFRMAHIIDQVQLLLEKGFGVVLIVSGAVALGSQVVDTSEDQLGRQVAAGIGQVRLISTMSKICVQKKIEIAQILLTKEIFDKKDRQDNLKKMFTFYFQKRILPVVNENENVIDTFIHSVDAASLMINCSTRLHDGYVYGFGAEMGIATGKLHVRGPVGLEGLTTYKWIVKGKGQMRR